MKRLFGGRSSLCHACSVTPPQLKASRHRQQCVAVLNTKGWDLEHTVVAGYSTLRYQIHKESPASAIEDLLH